MQKDSYYLSKINPSSGNVLFLILIAVALFAALSFAVTQATRSGGGDASAEKTLTDTSVIVQEGTDIKGAVTRMILSGIDPADLLFDPPETFSSLSLTADEIRREVFHPQGGGAIYSQGWIVTSSFEVTGMGRTATGNAIEASDIVAVKPVPRELCMKLNEKLGIDIEEANMDADMHIITANYNDIMGKDTPGINGGTSGYWGALGSGGSSPSTAPFDGMEQGCFSDMTNNAYLYYDVLVAR